ncbi:hypothetical protein BJX64DRAFT_290980 [Aspergillus heterothallicus]
MSEPTSSESSSSASPITPTGQQEHLPTRRAANRGPSPSVFTLPPNEKDTQDIGLFLAFSHDRGANGRDWVLLFMYPGYDKCDFYQSTMTATPPLDQGMGITDEYPYARLRLENMSADVSDLQREFQGWMAVGTMGEENWETFWNAWLGTNPGPSQWFIARFLDTLAAEGIVERRQVDEIVSCAAYSEAESALWGGDGGFVADVEWVEEMQFEEDERLIDEMQAIMAEEARAQEEKEALAKKDGDA